MGNEEKECLYCGTKFAAQGKKKYCTYRCGILYHQRLNRRKYEPRICTVCGEEFLPRSSVQVTCGKPDCVKNNSNKQLRGVYRSRGQKKYQYSKWEGLSLPEKKRIRTKMTVKKWNALSASERWELMNLTELSGEIARMFPGKSFAQVRLLKEQGTLPEDFGKRTENNG